MKRTTTTRPNGFAGATRTSTSALSQPPQKKSRIAGERNETSKGKSEEGERDKEAAFMASLLADLDDDFWNAAPTSSPQASPVKKRGAGVVGKTVGATSSSTSSTSVNLNESTRISTINAPGKSTPSLVRAPITPVKNGNTNKKLPSHHPSSKTNEPKRSASTSTSTSDLPFASSSSSSSLSNSSLLLSTSASALSSSAGPSLKSTSKPGPSSKATSAPAPTPTGFNLQAFLQGSEDWDLGDGALSPVKPVVKPAIQPQPSRQSQFVQRTVVPHTRGLPHGPGADARKTESKREVTTYTDGKGAYTPDPCTRCVVLSVEDISVDGGEGGNERKKWEKHIRALAHVPNTSETTQHSEEEKKKEKVEVEVVLCDGWYETDVHVDDVFNIIGHFTPRLTFPATSTLTPTIRLTFTSTTSNHDTNNNLLILHPDVLLTATALSSAAQCARKPVLSSLVRQSASGVVGGEGDNKASPAMVYGNILHEVLDRCLVADRWGIDLKEGDPSKSESGEGVNEQWMNKCIDEAIRGSLGELVRLGLEEGDVRREIRERARGFGLFAQRYLGRTPKEDGILNNTRTLARDAPSKLAITHLLDIEEDIWSPAYGIKGKIDAVVRGIIDDPVLVQQPLYNSGLKRTGHNTFDTTTTTRTVTRMQRHTPLPLELKTGRVQTGMDHRAQTMLYTLLLSERYNVDVRDGLLFYSRLRENEDGNTNSANGKLVGEDMVRVPRGWNEIRGLIGLRNRLAGYIWRRIRKTKDTAEDPSDVDNIPNRQEDFHIKKERDIEEEEDFLPPPVDDEWTCKRCYALDTCLLFRKTHPPLSLPATQNQKPIPAIPPPGRLRQLFDAHTAHLTPARVAFFKKWEALLALEERDMVRFKRELWVLGAQEREKRGRCLGGMRVTAIGPGASDDAGSSQTHAQDEDGDGEEGKWGKEGKIYRFVYTLEKDLDFLLENGDGKGKGSAADYNLSLQNTHLVKGDPITISLMGPRQVLALARGYILDFQVINPLPDRSDLSSFDPDSDSDNSDVEVAEAEDEDANMLFNLGMHVGNESDDESEVSKHARKTERERERRRKRMNRSPRGRVIIGVDHSLHPWLSGNVGGGTPLGVNLGGRHGHRAQSTYQQRRSTMTPQSLQDQGGVGSKAIFRIDKDELFGGMSRVRENLASLFYASGPVSVPTNGENTGQTTTTTMGRGNKKLLELVVDLRAPQFDDGARDDVEVEVEVEVEQEEVGIDVHTAEARYLEATRDSRTPASPILNKKEEEHQNTQNQEQQQQHTQHLNPAQSLAIQRALSARDYALILGMPGTGKTCVIAALVKELVFGSSTSISTSTSASKPIRRRRRPKTVLISSYTHSAVDSILRKLVEGGGWDMDLKRRGGIVRLGNIEKIHPEVRKFSPTFSKGDEKEMTVEELEEIYMNASVVATTCLGLDHPLFSRRRFDYCILDEASQITLPTCLGPLRFADVFVLVGDHHQLPPLVKNPLARPPIPVDSKSPLTIEALTSTPSLTTSLFLLLSTAHPESVVELTEQYRMNEDIMTISNELVYGGRMTCGVGAGVMGLDRVINDEEDFLRSLHRASSTLLEEEEGGNVTMYKQCRGAQGGDECWLERLCDDRTKAIFINTDALPSARESRVGDLVQNLGEAQLVGQFVETLRRKGVHGSRVGVVTLYRQQVKVLEGLLNGVDHKGDVVEIMTADKSQGRDKDCVVVSLVRSNEAGRIGDLVKDWRRINVSFTRARCKLVIFGSRQTLEREPMLSRFFDLMDRKGWVLDLKEGAERAHEHAWSLPMAIAGVRLDVGRDVGGVGSMKRSRTEDEEDDRGIPDPHRRTKENGSATSSSSSSSWDGDKKFGVDSTRPVKRIRSEDKPDALLKGRPVLRDLVGNEMCL